jgi:hypothetical protein
VVLLQKSGHIVESGRIGRKLADLGAWAFGKSAGNILAPFVIRADQSNRQMVGAMGFGIVGFAVTGRE